MVPATLAALGIVYGDIGTSPLYALRACFVGSTSLEITQANVLGVLSLIFWSLILVVSVKYLVFVMRADRDGEGGILALMSLTNSESIASVVQKRIRLPWTILLGLFGASLLYGDGMITPAISVLSAIEGIHVATDRFDHLVIPTAIIILCGLFSIQKNGTARLGRWFGPAMIIWFAVIGLLGSMAILNKPTVLNALNPIHAVSFFTSHGTTSFATLGVVFLVVTGGEALYADMGHFGKQPIRLAWFSIVLPSLLLNYFGQGSLLLSDPTTVANPFYRLAPSWAVVPLVVLSTIATIIASQAIISGVFSLTSQAVSLGYLPRVSIVHTSRDERGQIYVPVVNWAMFLAVVALVIAFKKSDNLAAAYGMAVTTTMVITSILLYVVARSKWRWHASVALLVIGCFLVVDVAFFVANLPKIPDGGWFPLFVGAAICGLMLAWWTGKRRATESLERQSMSMNAFLMAIQQTPPKQLDLPAVYLASSPHSVPLAMLHNVRHNGVLHRPVAILSVIIEDRPWVPLENRVDVKMLGHNVVRIVAHYGYKQAPNIPNVLEQARQWNVDFTGANTTFFLGRRSFEFTKHRTLTNIRNSVFSLLSKSADDPSSHFHLPPDQVVEIGMRVPL